MASETIPTRILGTAGATGAPRRWTIAGPRSWLLPLLWIALAACDPKASESDRRLEYEPPPPPDLEALGRPRAEDGTFLINRMGPLELRVDRDGRTPMMAQRLCVRWVAHCKREGAGSFDACVDAVPTCSGAEPRTHGESCCPPQVIARYREQRDAGEAEWDAFEGALRSHFDPLFEALFERTISKLEEHGDE